MYHIKLSGSYEQMGRKHGRLLKRSGFTQIEIFGKF